MAAYLYETLAEVLWDMGRRQGKERGRSSHNLINYIYSFIISAAREIHARILAEKKAAQEAPASGAKSTALIHVKIESVNQRVEEHIPNLRNRNDSSRRSDYQAMVDGRQAGKTVPIRRGVENQKTLALP